MTDDEGQNKRAAFAQYLNKKFMEWNNKQVESGKPPQSKRQWARVIGISDATLSQWTTGARWPEEGEPLYLLADKLGPEVWEVLGRPPRMPRDKKLSHMAKKWAELSDSQKGAMYEYFLNLTGEGFDDKESNRKKTQTTN